jgi:hypothetical protein
MPVSVSPSIPTESSTAAPAGGFSGWFKNIGDWITSLSPSGATQYDTGWLTTGLTITAGTDWTVDSYRVRRVGMVIFIRVSVTYTGAGFTTTTIGDVANSTIFTLPAGWRPGENSPLYVNRDGAHEWFGRANASGDVQLTHGQASQTLATSTAMMARGMLMAA